MIDTYAKPKTRESSTNNVDINQPKSEFFDKTYRDYFSTPVLDRPRQKLILNLDLTWFLTNLTDQANITPQGTV